MSSRRVLIVGLGAMGTSIGLALRERDWHVLYIDKRELADTRGAHERGNFDDPVDLTIIATPEDEALRVLPQTRGLVTSVCSLMGPLRRAATGDFVAGHPMAGTEKSGPEGASEKMFAGQFWFVDRDQPIVREMIETCGATQKEIDVDEHDLGVALGSHLPQLLSTALAAHMHDNPDALRFSATGLKTFLRLAGSGAEMWKPLIADNKQNIAPHAEAVAQIVRDMLEKDPTAIFKAANEVYDSLK